MLAETAYIISFCVFMVGTTRSFRDNGSPQAVTLMVWAISAGVVILFCSLFFAGGLGDATPPGVRFVVYAGLALVCLAFIAGLVLRRKGMRELFHCFVAMAELLWFVVIVLALYSRHVFPLLSGRN